eukprot:TRINITY_DN718_c0_g1_i6.p1 TRINITY_DN718_c0_g1~~TRINITY_DN718_c0_g1_i6.p1  ORF type:complete len:378 (-),score=53.69 TRINITY_DN718_c0_g1_i6:168-1301(-)
MLANLAKRAFTAGPKQFLITGCGGQCGKALIPVLQQKYGANSVIGTDLQKPDWMKSRFMVLDIMHKGRMEKMIKDNNVNCIVHYAAILSAAGEKIPEKAKDINIRGLENIFDLALKYKCQVFNASSIASYGGDFPREETPEDCNRIPTTIYGISKIYGELLGSYYNKKFGLDYRSLRYPVIVSSEEYAYQGTAIYTTEMFFKAIKDKKYECYVNEQTRVPAIHVDDCIKATVQLMEADDSKFSRRTYNLGGLSYSAGDLANEIKRHIPEFECTFKPDERQAIADTWPKKLLDPANAEWGWNFTQTLPELVDKIFNDIKEREAKAKEPKAPETITPKPKISKPKTKKSKGPKNHNPRNQSPRREVISISFTKKQHLSI